MDRMKKPGKAIILPAAFAVAVALWQGRAPAADRQDTQGEGQRIIDHCGMITSYGRDYALLRASGKDAMAAWEQATSDTEDRLGPHDHDKLAAITGAYGILIERLGVHRPDSTGYFAGAACMASHGMHRKLPMDSDDGVAAVNAVLARCEQESGNDDALGACILDGLRALAT